MRRPSRRGGTTISGRPLIFCASLDWTGLARLIPRAITKDVAIKRRRAARVRGVGRPGGRARPGVCPSAKLPKNRLGSCSIQVCSESLGLCASCERFCLVAVLCPWTCLARGPGPHGPPTSWSRSRVVIPVPAGRRVDELTPSRCPRRGRLLHRVTATSEGLRSFQRFRYICCCESESDRRESTRHRLPSNPPAEANRGRIDSRHPARAH
jgi:hypothetical protein